MPMGPGKYDKECESVHHATKSAATLLIVVDGDRGSGFSVTLDFIRTVNINVPAILRFVANDIEKSTGMTQ